MVFNNGSSARFASLLLTCLVGCAAEVGDLPSEAGGEVAAGETEAALVLARTPNPAKELFVTDLSVVNDAKYTSYRAGKFNMEPEGGFSFGRLMDNASPVEKPTDRQRSDRVMKWLRLWETPQAVNGQVLAARPAVRDVLITPWKLASIGKLAGNTSTTCNASPATDFTCKLSMAPEVVPFRLLAIVNRPDLRKVPDPNDPTTGSAAQGRFVFGVLDAARQALQFTVIFEYMVPIRNAADIQLYATAWHKLGDQTFGKGYTDKLFDITRAFSRWNAAPFRRNGSALLQIRTNELALAEPGSDPTSPKGLMWELREFVIGANGDFVADTVKQEPPIALSGSEALGQWAAANSAAILAGTYEVPALLPNGAPFLAASSFTPFAFNWQVPGVSEDVRRSFALGTCNGCHRSETSTSFLHVKNREPGAASVLSTFLTAELDVNGPRVADFKQLLTQDPIKIVDGKGKDRGADR